MIPNPLNHSQLTRRAEIAHPIVCALQTNTTLSTRTMIKLETPLGCRARIMANQKYTINAFQCYRCVKNTRIDLTLRSSYVTTDEGHLVA